MRSSAAILLLLCLAGSTIGIAAYRRATENSRAWNRFLKLEGADLSAGPASVKDARDLVDRFATPAARPDRVSYRPWHVFRIDRDTPGEHVLLAFLVATEGDFEDPGVRVDVLAPPGRLLWTGEFRTGFATRLRSARVEAGRLVLVTSNEPDSSDPCRQYYAFVGGRLRFLRMEGEDRKARRNEFGCMALIVGAIPENLAPDAWESDLAGGVPELRLAHLAYLGGWHPPHAPAGTPGHVERVRAVTAARAHTGVRARVLELRKSADPWIREAAQAVPLDGSP